LYLLPFCFELAQFHGAGPVFCQPLPGHGQNLPRLLTHLRSFHSSLLQPTHVFFAVFFLTTKLQHNYDIFLVRLLWIFNVINQPALYLSILKQCEFSIQNTKSFFWSYTKKGSISVVTGHWFLSAVLLVALIVCLLKFPT